MSTAGGTADRRSDASTPERGTDRALLTIALILVLGALAPLLDSTIVNVALHTLGHDLGAPVATIQWVSTGYLLAVALAIPAAGWTADRFGARRMWLVSLLLFLAGSLLCGAAWNLGSLIAFRAVQGVGGGLMLPILQTLLMRAAGGRALGRLMAVVTLPALAGPILGPVAGGLIVGHLDWRWIFLVNPPICLAAFHLARRHLPADPPGRAPHLDVTGLSLLSPGLAALVYALATAGTGGPARPRVLLPFALGAALLCGFAVHALRTRPPRRPLLDLRLFRSRGFSASAVLLFLSGFALFGSMLLLPLYYQQVRGASVVTAGLLLVPQGIGSLLARPAGGLADRIGPRPVVLTGCALTALGTLPFALPLHHPSALLLGAALVVRGFGLSAANIAIMLGAYRGIGREEVPHASVLTRIAQQLGGSFGAALLAVLLQHALHTHAPTEAYALTFAVALGLTAASAVPALFLPREG
ncbi:drug resistance transporter, EmrB/QacA subfamily [Actinacidiphila yanglinensis]|uniref:Drug resistance transporter, EmrB/QacA subfamily n=1 Tax=Actinacidiphila yanglinensis TaxID=310779 RepID=A0A1H5Z4C2_9ACTN|nr:MDR family MFS transporter [Actinacidiphila yanglinensis]SEG31112.1 drug resistance transporter, EmrB/QacA subfamily [Actinacidiphila yanglinensis]